MTASPIPTPPQRRLFRPPVRLKFASIFAGIAGFDLGLERAGMQCVAQVERDKYCLSVLEHHFPHVERRNDVRSFGRSTAPEAATSGELSLLCGGFPCQDISVAGKRAGLAGERSGLFWEFVRCVREFRPRWIVLENVAGLLSSNGGRDMGAVVGALAKCGYWWAYRVLDSQYYGVPQRRRRVFIVAHSRERTYPARVLFESESLPWDPPPSRKTQQGVAGTLDAGSGVRRGAGINPGILTPDVVAPEVAASLTAGMSNTPGVNPPGRRKEDDVNLVATWWDGSDIAPCLDSSMLAKQQMMPEKGRFAAVIQDVTHTLTGEGHDASEDGTGRGVPLVPVVANPLKAGGNLQHDESHDTYIPVAATLNSGGNTGGFRTEPGERLVPVDVVPIDMRQASRGDKMTNNRPGGSSGGAPGTGIGEPGDPCPTLAGSHRPAIAYTATDYTTGSYRASEVAAPLTTGTDQSRSAPLIAEITVEEPFTFQTRCSRNGRGMPSDVVPALTSCEGGTHADTKHHVVVGRSGAPGSAVRRLTPRECERLQGFPDDWTAFGAGPDGPTGQPVPISNSQRYKMCGNAVSEPVIYWIGSRIIQVELECGQ